MDREILDIPDCIRNKDNLIAELRAEIKENKLLICMKEDELDHVHSVCQELREALKAVYAHCGEDEFINSLCDPLITKTESI